MRLLRVSPTLSLLLMLLAALPLAGCRGCRTSPVAERKKKSLDIDELEKQKKEKEKPKEDFEFKVPRVLPDEPDATRAFVKPGHWVSVRNIVKANNFDFQAELLTRVTDSQGKPWLIENTDYEIVGARPAPLPKGQDKAFDTAYHVPLTNTPDVTQQRTVWLARELRAARGGRLVMEDVRQGTVAMPAYQYFFVVLANEPTRYAFLKSQPSFAAPTSGQLETTEKLVYYRVVAPTIDRIAPLPNQALTWSSIAYLLWDDLTPTTLTSNQQQALLDWLHWGGQLIISGPNSLEKLRGSFLDPYLPAQPGNSITAAQSSIDELNDYWSLPDRRKGGQATLDVPPDKPLPVIEMTPQGSAQMVPHCGDLVIERRAGNGRVVVTAFSLTDTRILRWRSFDNFFNGAILRRPHRNFRQVDSLPDTIWAEHDASVAMDARPITTLRYFSRDIGHHVPKTSGRDWEPGEKPLFEEASPNDVRFQRYYGDTSMARPTPQAGQSADDWHFRGYPFRHRTGMAAWNDRSGASDAARDHLADASGISVPKGEFVFKVLAVYLLVLAPLNWLVFRLLGRVEWAWLAAPLIAMGGTFAVVRLAQLDIGFARSTTEVAIAEVQAGYSRAHVTRYAALYTSLSTSYDLEFADDASLAQPFAAVTSKRPAIGASHQSVMLRRDRNLRLSDFVVGSNSAEHVHCEQMVDLGGAFQLNRQANAQFELVNNTDFALSSAGVLRRTSDGRFEAAWIGDLPAKGKSLLKFNDRDPVSEWRTSYITLSYASQIGQLLKQWDNNDDGVLTRAEVQQDPHIREIFDSFDEHRDGQWDANHRDGRWDREELRRWCRESRAGELSLGNLIELAAEGIQLLPGEMRLIAWTDDEIPGVIIRPTSSQRAHRTMFLVHLDPGRLPEPKSDLRLWSDVIEVMPENLLEGEEATATGS